MNAPSSGIVAAALDLGTTRIKAGLLDAAGNLAKVESLPAPPLSGEGLIKESDPLLYLETARRVLREVTAGLPRGTPLGLASQRSSFLLWEPAGGEPLTPLVSWQDRRAGEWCRLHGEAAPFLEERTGLHLSPHYAGPKLAHLLATRGDLRRKALSGTALFGTLDTWFRWHLSRTAGHRTDLSMASRTLLADIAAGEWDEGLLAFFGVPRGILPSLGPSWEIGEDGEEDMTPAASLSDQTSAFFAAAAYFPGSILVNLGTGGFVMTSTGDRLTRKRGYLTSPMGSAPGGTVSFLLEGTVNGIGGISRGHPGKGNLPPREDPSPGLFCIPDRNGIGSPWWLPEGKRTFSLPEESLSREERERAVLEGVVFRVRQIVDDLAPGRRGRPVVLTGGLSTHPFLASGLAAVMEGPLYRLPTPEATLAGAAMKAAGQNSPGGDAVLIPEPVNRGRYLPSKYRHWARWARGILGSPSLRR